MESLAYELLSWVGSAAVAYGAAPTYTWVNTDQMQPSDSNMEIWVSFDDGKLSSSPDPARVQQGTPVTWRFLAGELGISQLRWVVYFTYKHPFGDQGSQFVTNTDLVGRQHTGSTGAMSADDPGDYKYGVRLVDSRDQKTLADDDPRLVVLAEL